MVANYLPRTLVLLDAISICSASIPPRPAGRESRVSAVYDAAPRRAFVAAMKTSRRSGRSATTRTPSRSSTAGARLQAGEGLQQTGFLTPRRTRLDDVLDDFFFDASYAYVMGASRGRRRAGREPRRARKIADLDLPDAHLGSGITWQRDGRTVMATPNLKEGVVSVVDMQDWSVVREIPTLGPGSS